MLACVGVALAWCLAVSGGEPWTRAGERGGDVALYESIARRVQGGEGYYDAMGAELRSRGYQTRSVLNWRTPLHLSLIARLPSSGWAWLLLLVPTGGAIIMAFAVMVRDGRPVAGLALAPLMLASFQSLMPGGTMYAEVWAGVWIAVSVGAHCLGWWRVGATAALLALFFRELALPYVLISAWLAHRQQRKSELAVLLVGLAAYAAYFGWHASEVLPRMTETDVEATWREAWIRFGGVRFILTASRQGLLLGGPLWVTALYVPVALFGLAGWTNPIALRLLLTVGAYLLAFSVLGRPVQFYWGAVYNVLLSFGAILSVAAFRDLVRALWLRSPAGTE